MDDLLVRMGKCRQCHNLKTKAKDCSLIHIYEDIEFAKNIPSIWTDWYNRVNADIMIIGQDWGPYEDMKKLNANYQNSKTPSNWKNLIEAEKSLTKKQLTKFIKESSNNQVTDLDGFYITNAIMCARNGSSYRGDNINLKKSTIYCRDFLSEQISIVKPKIILTLGYYPLLALSEIFNFEIKNTLKECIAGRPLIKIKDYIIIPLYHPVAQIKKEKQLEQYRRIWNSLEEGEKHG